MSGDDYRRARAQAAWALESLNKIIPAETIDGLDWRWLAEQIERSPENFLAAAAEIRRARTARAPARKPICPGQYNRPDAEKSFRASWNGR